LRTEHDDLGERCVPDDVYYGIHTLRALDNFQVSRTKISDIPFYIKAIGMIKKAAAKANIDLGLLESHIGESIIAACDDVISGRLNDQFPSDVFQGGGGTSTNMNANEVIANKALEMLGIERGSYEVIHPINHINMCQSTNDVIPTAVALTTYWNLLELEKAMENLRNVLVKKAVEFANIIKLGRTCLQDAVPLTLGQEFGGYKELITRCLNGVRNVQQHCLEVSLGATAIGTELNTVPGYRQKVLLYLSEYTGLRLIGAKDLFDALQNLDQCIIISAQVKTCAIAMSKIANDLRLLSSGPRAGFSELELPAVQAGSSIMPGKFNPVIPELVNQVCYQVCGNDAAITMAVDAGELDLNTMGPVIIKNLIEAITLTSRTANTFGELCLMGVKANPEKCRYYAESSMSISSVLSPIFGHEVASTVAHEAMMTGDTIAMTAVKRGLLSQEEAELLLDPANLVDPVKNIQLCRSFIAAKTKG